jgi:hypothetical protein
VHFAILSLSNFGQESSYLTFDLWLPRGASFGFYARRNALPTHTHYNIMEVITGYKKDRTTRSTVGDSGTRDCFHLVISVQV